MMTRNTKIAVGCGGVGCLGLIGLVVLVAALIYTGVIKAPGIYSPPSNSNYNSNYNFNSNVNTNDNSNSNSSSNDNSNSNSDSSRSSSSLSDDDRHKMFQAVGITKDNALIQKVLKKIGLFTQYGTPANDYSQFMKDHFAWAMKNIEFIQSVNTPEKGRAYVEEHIDD